MTDQKIEEEMLRVRERLHDLSGLVSQVSLQIAAFAHTNEQIRNLQASVKSLTDSYNSNQVDMLQRVTSTERWQEAHEKLDEVRWQNLESKLSELKGMLETIPIKVEEDLASDHVLLKDLGEAYKEMQGAFKTLKWIGALVAFSVTALEALHVWAGR